MPYKNIVFVKLEKRILNDPRWYMLGESAQLNFVKLMLFAAETYNKIPKNILAIKKAFKSDQEPYKIEETIKEIKKAFPKFKEGKHYYYFQGFSEKTNWVSPRELPRNSKGISKEVTDKEKEKEKEKYLDFVYLSKNEFEKLCNKFGDVITNEWIATLNEGIGSKGYKYESHYHAILAWHRKKEREQQQSEKRYDD